jgi:two-component system, chemotaxis family, chemotaxis protein CheY
MANSWSFSTSIAFSKSCLTCWRPKIGGRQAQANTALTRLHWKRPVWDSEEIEAEMKTCLVVDDSSVIRKVARRILEGLDFHIVEAEDGEKALEVCKRGLPEAILLDWNMPVMDGYEFLGNLRRMPGGDQPKVVFCTTENDVAHIARALHAGANEYIMKPFDKDIVTAKFQEVGLI